MPYGIFSIDGTIGTSRIFRNKVRTVCVGEK
jgi:hypothetical protein